MKKMWWLSGLLALPLVAAAGPLDVLSGIWDKILWIGGIGFLQGFGLVAFTRILLAILCFTLFFAVLSVLPASKDGSPRFKRQHAIVIAAVMAIISAIFLPAAAILAVGAGWATAIGLILIGAPILGLGYVLWTTPGKDEAGNSQETKGTVLFKLLLSMLLFWILSAMNYSLVAERGVAIGQASVAGTMANFIAWALYIASIMIIWYIIKFFITSSPGADAEKDKQWQEGGKAMGKWLGNKFKEQKAQEAMGRRAQEVKPVKSYLINAIEGCEGLVTALFSGVRTPEEQKAAVRKAEKHHKEVRRNMKRAVRGLQQLRRKERRGDNPKVYEIFNTLFEHAAVAYDAAKSLELPKAGAEDWEQKKAAAHKVAINDVRGVCGAIVKALDQFIESQEIQIQQAAAHQRAQEQAQQREQQQEARQQTAQQRVQEQAAQRKPQARRPRSFRRGRK